MANEKMISGLQTIVTGLSQGATGHQIQSRIFANAGFTKLADKYAEHAEEERGYVTKCIDRLLDLGCDVKLEAKGEAPVCKDPVEYLKYDLQVSIYGLAWLKEIVEAAREDYTTFDMLKDYYQDEEEDMYWAQEQLDLIECIGKQNWLIQQL
ncbi:MAG: ferritin-like domain-containing protein [Synergistes jonesii]|uniref:ferritin-like domain-containing protein n=1 Tax=Synergistes jonesii TaxID=2754 RepID=UPI002A752BC0|nr:ferritin-like domain-containing protein [Synergistes jonesii]MDY2983697.1 ferritin-like domain-containing protein [Synergistes jonesii]